MLGPYGVPAVAEGVTLLRAAVVAAKGRLIDANNEPFQSFQSGLYFCYANLQFVLSKQQKLLNSIQF